MTLTRMFELFCNSPHYSWLSGGIIKKMYCLVFVILLIGAMNVFAEDDDCFVGEQRQYTVGTQCAEDAFQDYEIDSVCEEDEGFRFLKETNEKIDFLIYCLQDEKVVILRGEKPTLEMILLKLSLMQTARAKQYYLDELCVNFVFHNSDLFALYDEEYDSDGFEGSQKSADEYPYSEDDFYD